MALSPSFFTSTSVLGCPIARKRRLEEAEAEQEQDTDRPASKRKTHPLKLTLDEGFSTESDTSSETEVDEEKDEEEAGETKRTEEKEEEMDVVVKEDREGMKEDLTRDGHTNRQVAETHEEEKEEQETYQKEDNTFAADEGGL